MSWACSGGLHVIWVTTIALYMKHQSNCLCLTRSEQTSSLGVKKLNVNFFFFTHGAPEFTRTRQKCRIGIWICWFLRRGENRSTRKKASRSRVEHHQQTQPTYDDGSGNRTRATLVGGERSHHCARMRHPNSMGDLVTNVFSCEGSKVVLLENLKPSLFSYDLSVIIRNFARVHDYKFHKTRSK